jgi:L-lactate dehydrogenase complex protein LldF
MEPRVRRAVADVQLQQFVDNATFIKDRGRVDALAAAFGDRADDVRALAGSIKQHTIDHLDLYLERFVERARANGTRMHFAADAAQANAIVTGIARGRGCRLCVKSKSMVTEEIGLLAALEAIDVETVETDLGEFIVQLDDDAPSHIVTPMIHKDRAAVARAFVRELGADYTEEPEALTRIAREHLREKYRRADLGISGGNFLLADTGAVVICTNEGNADFVVAGPPVHVAVVGIEKLIPTAAHLPVFLKLLARSATAQELTVYTTAIAGPRRTGEHDGPEEVHVVLVDNGRSALLADDRRELLRCIRCGACLNACPVYRAVGGGHAYGAVYSGPIGAVLTPLLKGLDSYPDLPQASSLCGACARACPVQIDIPAHLVRLRERQVDEGVVGRGSRLAYRAWAATLRRPRLYRLASALARVALRLGGRDGGRGERYGDRRWIRRLPGPLSGWTDERDFPTPTSESFRHWWARHEREARK